MIFAQSLKRLWYIVAPDEENPVDSDATADVAAPPPVDPVDPATTGSDGFSVAENLYLSRNFKSEADPDEIEKAQKEAEVRRAELEEQNHRNEELQERARRIKEGLDRKMELERTHGHGMGHTR